MKRVLLSVAALSCLAVSGQAAIWGFSVPIISGAQEVPPHNSNAYGTASFTVNDQNWAIQGSVNVWNLSPTQITGMHIHEAPVGVNGPIRFDIMMNQVAGSPFNAGTFWIYAFSGTLATANNTAFLNTMINDGTYINVHTPTWPGGEIRGQVECNGVVPEPASLAALGFGLVPFLRRRFKK